MNHEAALAEIANALKRLEPEPDHTRHVAKLAVRLFDETVDLHHLGRDERVILEGAACLHDVGWPVSEGGAAHHKLSARVIRDQAWAAFSQTEVEMLALVARYHRKALPCSEHVDYLRLPKARREAVRILAALLRLADAFDRSHLQLVRDVHVRVSDQRLEITLISPFPPEREIAAASKKGNLATEVFQRELTFRFVPTAVVR